MPPANIFHWFCMKLHHRATTTASTCISFLLLVVSLLSPSWVEIIMPETYITPIPVITKVCNNMTCNQLDGKSDLFKASKILLILTVIAGFISAFSLLISCRCLRRCGRQPNMLVSSTASFATGALGFITMTLYTVDVAQKEMSSIGNLHFTWSFCLAWMVFSLYIMNGFFSLLSYLLSPVSSINRHTSPLLLGARRQQPESEDHTSMQLSVLSGPEELASPARNLFPDSSICFSSTLI